MALQSVSVVLREGIRNQLKVFVKYLRRLFLSSLASTGHMAESVKK